ncbi:titin-like [Hibiscus syriacus]|uniref:titin-like n=1 Tax=Hibiscus syriacus TaxID=106335 RepID=UPI0019215E36|nr:titin-like [Hibiscus syriacus]
MATEAVIIQEPVSMAEKITTEAVIIQEPISMLEKMATEAVIIAEPISMVKTEEEGKQLTLEVSTSNNGIETPDFVDEGNHGIAKGESVSMSPEISKVASETCGMLDHIEVVSTPFKAEKRPEDEVKMVVWIEEEVGIEMGDTADGGEELKKQASMDSHEATVESLKDAKETVTGASCIDQVNEVEDTKPEKLPAEEGKDQIVFDSLGETLTETVAESEEIACMDEPGVDEKVEEVSNEVIKCTNGENDGLEDSSVGQPVENEHEKPHEFSGVLPEKQGNEAVGESEKEEDSEDVSEASQSRDSTNPDHIFTAAAAIIDLKPETSQTHEEIVKEVYVVDTEKCSQRNEVLEYKEEDLEDYKTETMDEKSEEENTAATMSIKEVHEEYEITATCNVKENPETKEYPITDITNSPISDKTVKESMKEGESKPMKSTEEDINSNIEEMHSIEETEKPDNDHSPNDHSPSNAKESKEEIIPIEGKVDHVHSSLIELEELVKDSEKETNVNEDEAEAEAEGEKNEIHNIVTVEEIGKATTEHKGIDVNSANIDVNSTDSVVTCDKNLEISEPQKDDGMQDEVPNSGRQDNVELNNKEIQLEEVPLDEVKEHSTMPSEEYKSTPIEERKITDETSEKDQDLYEHLEKVAVDVKVVLDTDKELPMETEVLDEMKRDEESNVPMPEGIIIKSENVDLVRQSQEEISKEENLESFQQKNEPEKEKPVCPLNVVSEYVNTAISGETVEAEISNKNADDIHVTDSSIGQLEENEHEKQHEFSDVESEEQVHASKEKEEDSDDVSKACQSRDRTNPEHTLPDAATTTNLKPKTNKMDNKNTMFVKEVYLLDSQNFAETNEALENKQEGIQEELGDCAADATENIEEVHDGPKEECAIIDDSLKSIKGGEKEEIPDVKVCRKLETNDTVENAEKQVLEEDNKDQTTPKRVHKVYEITASGTMKESPETKEYLIADITNSSTSVKTVKESMKEVESSSMKFTEEVGNSNVEETDCIMEETTEPDNNPSPSNGKESKEETIPIEVKEDYVHSSLIELEESGKDSEKETNVNEDKAEAEGEKNEIHNIITVEEIGKATTEHKGVNVNSSNIEVNSMDSSITCNKNLEISEPQKDDGMQDEVPNSGRQDNVEPNKKEIQLEKVLVDEVKEHSTIPPEEYKATPIEERKITDETSEKDQDLYEHLEKVAVDVKVVLDTDKELPMETEVLDEMKRDEESNVLMPEGSIIDAENVDLVQESQEEILESFQQKNEPEKEKHVCPLNVVSEMVNTTISGESVETSTNIEEATSIADLEERSEGEGREDSPTDHMQIEVNESIKTVEAEISNKNADDIHVADSSIGQLEENEHEKQHEFYDVQPVENKPLENKGEEILQELEDFDTEKPEPMDAMENVEDNLKQEETNEVHEGPTLITMEECAVTDDSLKSPEVEVCEKMELDETVEIAEKQILDEEDNEGETTLIEHMMKEKAKEDNTAAMVSIIEASNSVIEEMDSIEETAKSNNDPNLFDIVKESKEEITPIKVDDSVCSSSFELEESKNDTEEETQISCAAETEETNIKGAEADEEKNERNNVVVVKERSLETTQLEGIGVYSAEMNVKSTTEKDTEIPREIDAVQDKVPHGGSEDRSFMNEEEIPLKEILGYEVKEYEPTFIEERKISAETSEKYRDLYEHSEILLSQETDEKLMQNEHNPQLDVPKVEPEDTGNESRHEVKEQLVKEPNVEVTNISTGEEHSEQNNQTNSSKAKTLQDEKSSDLKLKTQQNEDGKPLDEATDLGETVGTCNDDKNVIKEENLAKSLEETESLKEDSEIGKVQIPGVIIMNDNAKEEDYNSVNECLNEAESKEKIVAENLEVEDDSTNDGEASHIIKELEETRQDEESGDPVSVHSEDREAENKTEIIHYSKQCHEASCIEAVTEVRAETSLNDADENSKALNIRSVETNPEIVESDANQETEVENVQLEEIPSGFDPDVQTNDNDDVQNQNLNVETSDKDEAEVIKRAPDAFHTPEVQIDEADKGLIAETADELNMDHELVETKSEASKTSNTDGLGKIDDIGPPNTVLEVKPNEQIQTSVCTLLSEDEEIRIENPVEKIEEETQKDAETEHESEEDSSETKTIEEACLSNEEQRELKAVSEEETISDQGPLNDEPEEQIQTASSTLPSEESEHGTGATSEEIKYGITKEEEQTKLDAAIGDEVTGEQTTSPTLVSREKDEENICTVEEKISESSAAEETAMELSLQKEELLELDDAKKDAVEKDEKTIEEEVIKDEIEEDAKDTKTRLAICSQMERSVELEVVGEDETTGVETLAEKISDEQVLNLTTASKEEECESTISFEMIESERKPDEDASLQKDRLREDEALAVDDEASSQVILREKPDDLPDPVDTLPTNQFHPTTTTFPSEVQGDERKEIELEEEEESTEKIPEQTQEIEEASDFSTEIHEKAFESESAQLAEDQSEETFPESSKSQDDKTSIDVQNQETEEQIKEELKDKPEDEQIINRDQNAYKTEAVILSEEVDKEVEKAESCEGIEEYVMEKESSTDEIHPVTNGDEEINEVEVYSAVSTQCIQEAKSKETEEVEKVQLEEISFNLAPEVSTNNNDEEVTKRDADEVYTAKDQTAEAENGLSMQNVDQLDQDHELIGTKCEPSKKSLTAELEADNVDETGVPETSPDYTSQRIETILKDEDSSTNTFLGEKSEEKLQSSTHTLLCEDEEIGTAHRIEKIEEEIQNDAGIEHESREDSSYRKLVEEACLLNEEQRELKTVSEEEIIAGLQNDEPEAVLEGETNNSRHIAEESEEHGPITEEIKESESFEDEKNPQSECTRELHGALEVGATAVHILPDETSADNLHATASTLPSEVQEKETTETELKEDESPKKIQEQTGEMEETSNLNKTCKKPFELLSETDDAANEKIIIIAKDETGGEGYKCEKTEEGNEIKANEDSKEENVAIPGFEEKPKSETESVMEDQRKGVIPENTKSRDYATSLDVPNQETEEQIKEELKDKLEDEDSINREENMNEVTKAVILSEEVDKEVEKADGSEDIKENFMDKESSTNEIHPVLNADEPTNEVEDYSAVSAECIQQAESEEQIQAENSEVEENSTNDKVGLHITKELDERKQDEKSVDPVNVHGEDREAEEKVEIIEYLKLGYGESNSEAMAEERAEASLNDMEVNKEFVNTSNISSAKMSLENIKSDANQETEEVEKVQLEEISSDSAPKVLSSNNDEVEVIKRDPDEFYTAKDQPAEAENGLSAQKVDQLNQNHELIGTKSEPFKKSLTAELEAEEVEETEVVPETLSDHTSQRVETILKDDDSFTNTFPEEKSEEQLQSSTQTLFSEDEEMRTAPPIEKIEEIQDDAGIKHKIGEGSLYKKATQEVLHQEDKVLAEDNIDNASAPNILSEKPEEQIQKPSVTLPSEEHKHKTINDVDKTEEMKNGDSHGEEAVEEKSTEKDETREPEETLEGETNTCQVMPKESEEHRTVTEETKIREAESFEDGKITQSECTRELQGSMEDGAAAVHILPGETSAVNLHTAASTLPSEVEGNETEETEPQEDESLEKIQEQTREIVEVLNFNKETCGMASDNQLLAETKDAANEKKIVITNEIAVIEVLKKEIVELAPPVFEEKHKSDLEPVAEDQSKETLPEHTKSQDDKTRTDVQNQETEEQIKEELKDKVEAEGSIDGEQNKNEVTKAVILSEELVDGSEDIKAHVIEEESSTNELHPVSVDERTNEVEDYSAVSTEHIEAAESEEQIQAENSEDEKNSTSNKEGPHITKELDERRQDEESGDPVNVHSKNREAEEKVEIVDNLKLNQDKSHSEAVTEETAETSLNDTEVNKELVKTSNISSAKMSLANIESDANQETEEVEKVQIEERSSDLAPEVPTNNNDEEVIQRDPDVFYMSENQIAEANNGTTAELEDDKVEIEGVPEPLSDNIPPRVETIPKDDSTSANTFQEEKPEEQLQRSPYTLLSLPNEEQRELKAVPEEETIADKVIPNDEPEEQIPTTSSTLPSAEREHGAGAISEEIEYVKTKEEVTINLDVVTGAEITGKQTQETNKLEEIKSYPLVSLEKEADVSSVEQIEEEKLSDTEIPEKCLENEAIKELNDAKNNTQALQMEESNEQFFTSELPVENLKHRTETNDEEEVKEVEILEKEGPQESDAIINQETVVVQASITEESQKIEPISTFEKLGEEKRKEAVKVEEESCEDSSAGETKELNEFHLLTKEETTSCLAFSEDQFHIFSSSAITSEESKHEMKEKEDEKTSKGEIIKYEIEEYASDAKTTVEIYSQKGSSVEVEAVAEDEMIADSGNHKAEKIESKKMEDAEFLRDDSGEVAILQKELLQGDETLVVENNASSQTIPKEKPEEQIPNLVVTLPSEEHKQETINEVDKTEEEKIKEERIKNGDSERVKTVEELSTEKDQIKEAVAVLKEDESLEKIRKQTGEIEESSDINMEIHEKALNSELLHETENAAIKENLRKEIDESGGEANRFEKINEGNEIILNEVSKEEVASHSTYQWEEPTKDGEDALKDELIEEKTYEELIVEAQKTRENEITEKQIEDGVVKNPGQDSVVRAETTTESSTKLSVAEGKQILEYIQQTREITKTASDMQIPRDLDHIENTGITSLIRKEHVPVDLQDRVAGSSQKAEVRDVKEIYPGGIECSGEIAANCLGEEVAQDMIVGDTKDETTASQILQAEKPEKQSPAPVEQERLKEVETRDKNTSDTKTRGEICLEKEENKEPETVVVQETIVIQAPHTKPSAETQKDDADNNIRKETIAEDKIVKDDMNESPVVREEIPGKEDPIDCKKTINSTGKQQFLTEQQDEAFGTAGKALVGDLEPGTAQETCSESADSAKLLLYDLLQRSTRETIQGDKNVIEERELKVSNEEPPEEEAKTDEEGEGGEKSKKESGIKQHKKSNNILSGVGSKVKHSISKMKKAITGKSSHSKASKPISPKESKK